MSRIKRNNNTTNSEGHFKIIQLHYNSCKRDEDLDHKVMIHIMNDNKRLFFLKLFYFPK